ncbi:conserved hypothetical protein [Trichinella spiralis]|uniref:hypothetical protein n=1 Tax=Trichinella spiralis TaxID=6334 RepID=UPI0001EFCDA2|nr:conserved hypothetical protein [Trichinella spiralis]
MNLRHACRLSAKLAYSCTNTKQLRDVPPPPPLHSPIFAVLFVHCSLNQTIIANDKCACTVCQICELYFSSIRRELRLHRTALYLHCSLCKPLYSQKRNTSFIASSWKRARAQL